MFDAEKRLLQYTKYSTSDSPQSAKGSPNTSFSFINYPHHACNMDLSFTLNGDWMHKPNIEKFGAKKNRMKAIRLKKHAFFREDNNWSVQVLAAGKTRSKFKHTYFTSIENKFLQLITNLSRFSHQYSHLIRTSTRDLMIARLMFYLTTTDLIKSCKITISFVYF